MITPAQLALKAVWKGIEIGDNVFIGSGVHILYDTKIGSNVIIGTCSVVTHDIPANSIAVGNPAKVIKMTK